MGLDIVQTSLPGVLLIKSPVFRDERGYFTELYSQKVFEEAGFPPITFVQDNLSASARGTLRGMHYQVAPFGMGKLVRALRGAIYDVAVDLRQGSPTFGQWHGETLREDDGHALWIPPGFAHGFLALADNTLVFYKCDQFYTPSAERGIHYSDPTIAIQWPSGIRYVSEKDRQAPTLDKAEHNFQF